MNDLILLYLVSLHMDELIHWVSSHPTQGKSPFDQLVECMIEYTDRPVHSLQEMRDARSTKVKGDLFETLCVLYLTQKGYKVWRCKEIPKDICAVLGMTNFDVGIDLVVEKNGRYSAVQCKFKRPREGFVKGTWIPYNGVNWKEVSTFYSLCFRTQQHANWQHHIVMTNTKSVRRMGKATAYDKTYAYGTFNKLTTLNLLDMLPKKEETPILKSEEKPMSMSIEELREARLKRFSV